MSSQKLVSLESRIAIVVGVVDHRPFVRETGGEYRARGSSRGLFLAGCLRVARSSGVTPSSP